MRYPITPWKRVGYAFGDPWFNTGKFHTGWDVEAVVGQGVYAIADGTVYNHTHDPKWGYGVVVDHGGFGATYWHIDHFIADGVKVKEGDLVATVYDLQGNTHLHFGIWTGTYDEYLRTGALPKPPFPDRFVDPDEFLRKHMEDDMTPEQATQLQTVLNKCQGLEDSVKHLTEIVDYLQDDRATVAGHTGQRYDQSLIDNHDGIQKLLTK